MPSLSEPSDRHSLVVPDHLAVWAAALADEGLSFRHISLRDAQHLDMNGATGLCQDYGNKFAKLVMLFDPGNDLELKERLLRIVPDRIASLPSYAEHVALKIVEQRASCSVADVLAEAKDRNVDVSLFDRVIEEIKAIGFNAEDRMDRPETEEKIFRLRLWCYLAEEQLYGWERGSDTHARIFRLAPDAIEAFRAAHVDIYCQAA